MLLLFFFPTVFVFTLLLVMSVEFSFSPGFVVVLYVAVASWVPSGWYVVEVIDVNQKTCPENEQI